ncbi:hypothetical protein HGRIS_008889 [Hohenbuehelia grisea]|uniref:Uncharacterized protein n=1 Tax=Hohenbuehelia grisea TaxID=104357 RepID=A0ABR3IZU9_9AGAR
MERGNDKVVAELEAIKAEAKEQGLANQTKGILKVAAALGTLYFMVDKIRGSGPCDGNGGGTFKGNVVTAGAGVQAGTYTLAIKGTTAKLVLRAEGVNRGDYTGGGVAMDIEGMWDGAWN